MVLDKTVLTGDMTKQEIMNIIISKAKSSGDYNRVVERLGEESFKKLLNNVEDKLGDNSRFEYETIYNGEYFKIINDL